MPRLCCSAVALGLAKCDTGECSSASQGKQMASPNPMGSYQQHPKYFSVGIDFNNSSSAGMTPQSESTEYTGQSSLCVFFSSFFSEYI